MKALLIGETKRSEDIENTLKKNSIETTLVCGIEEICKKLGEDVYSCVIVDNDVVSKNGPAVKNDIIEAIKRSGREYMVVSSDCGFDFIDEARAMGARDIILRPYNDREFHLRFEACCAGKLKISCIGGGTGLYNVLSGLKKIPNSLLTSIVSMTDDGGSTGRLRESFGTLPPGDLRMSLVALSRASILMNKVLQYRFQSGGECFTGHNIGNLVLVALSEIFGSMKQGIKNLGEILNIQGIVIPVTMTNARLNAQFEDGTVIKGETRIDLGEGRNPELRIKKIWHEPPTECDHDAYISILCADAVVIGPGDLYTSVITNLEVGRLKDAVVKTSAKKIYICNLMTKPGETNDYSACDHVRDIISYLGCDCLDYVIISDTRFSSETLDSYTGEGQFQVMVDHGEKFSDITKARIIIADVAHGDGLIRHDGSKIRNVIEKVLRGPKEVKSLRQNN